MIEEEGERMRLTAVASRGRAISVHTALVSLLALAAVFVALVLMHGMNDTRTMVAHTGIAPAATAVSMSAGEAPGKPEEHPTGVHATSVAGSFVQHALPLPDLALMGQAEGGSGPWLGFAVFILLVLVSLAISLRLVPPRRHIDARPCRHVLARGGPGTLDRAIPIRLMLSIDRR